MSLDGILPVNVISYRGFHFIESREGEYSVEVAEDITFKITDVITIMAIEALFASQRKKLKITHERVKAT